MKRILLSIALCLSCAACACALDDDDRAAGKPPLWQCFAVNSLKAFACRNGTTNDPDCVSQPTTNGVSPGR